MKTLKRFYPSGLLAGLSLILTFFTGGQFGKSASARFEENQTKEKVSNNLRDRVRLSHSNRETLSVPLLSREKPKGDHLFAGIMISDGLKVSTRGICLNSIMIADS